MIIKRVKVDPPPPPPDVINIELTQEQATTLKGLLFQLGVAPHEQAFVNTLVDQLEAALFP